MDKNILKVDHSHDKEIVQYQLKQIKYYLNLVSIDMMRSQQGLEIPSYFAETSIFMDRAILISKSDYDEKLTVALKKLKQNLDKCNYILSVRYENKAWKLSKSLKYTPK